MLEGVVPFPPEYAKRYRERGYWADKSLAQEFNVIFERYADRVALIDRDRSITYAELDRLSDNLALNLLDAGFKPLDRVVVQLPNVAEFVILYFALQKIGCIPIAALGDATLRGNQPVCEALRRRGMRDPGPPAAIAITPSIVARVREGISDVEIRHRAGRAAGRISVADPN